MKFLQSIQQEEKYLQTEHRCVIEWGIRLHRQPPNTRHVIIDAQAKIHLKFVATELTALLHRGQSTQPYDIGIPLDWYYHNMKHKFVKRQAIFKY